METITVPLHLSAALLPRDPFQRVTPAMHARVRAFASGAAGVFNGVPLTAGQGFPRSFDVPRSTVIGPAPTTWESIAAERAYRPAPAPAYFRRLPVTPPARVVTFERPALRSPEVRAAAAALALDVAAPVRAPLALPAATTSGAAALLSERDAARDEARTLAQQVADLRAALVRSAEREDRAVAESRAARRSAVLDSDRQLRAANDAVADLRVQLEEARELAKIAAINAKPLPSEVRAAARKAARKADPFEAFEAAHGFDPRDPRNGKAHTEAAFAGDRSALTPAKAAAARKAAALSCLCRLCALAVRAPATFGEAAAFGYHARDAAAAVPRRTL